MTVSGEQNVTTLDVSMNDAGLSFVSRGPMLRAGGCDWELFFVQVLQTVQNTCTYYLCKISTTKSENPCQKKRCDSSSAKVITHGQAPSCECNPVHDRRNPAHDRTDPNDLFVENNSSGDHNVIHAARTAKFHDDPAVFVFHVRAKVTGDVSAFALLQNVDFIQQLVLFFFDGHDFDGNDVANVDVSAERPPDSLGFVHRTVRTLPQLLQKVEEKRRVFRGVLF